MDVRGGKIEGVLECVVRAARERARVVAMSVVDVETGAREESDAADLLERGRACARRVPAEMARGQVIVLFGAAGAEFAAWVLAGMMRGVLVLPVGGNVPAAEVVQTCVRARAAGVVLSGRDNETVAGVRDALAAWAAGHGVRVIGDEGTGESLRGSGGGVGHDDEGGGVVLASSGTTGLPKLIVRTRSALDADGAAVLGGLGLTPEDVVLAAVPLTHSFGLDLLLGCWYAGAELRVHSAFDAAALACEAERATVVAGVPFTFEALARCLPGGKGRPRVWVSAGATLSARVRREFRERWGGEISNLYGATELGTVTVERADAAGFDEASVGRALPGVSLRVLDMATMRDVERGSEGHLGVRAPSMLTDVLDGAVEMHEGHLLTGDLARVDKHGKLHITGRIKLLIDAGAFKVNPLEVEAVLREHPAVGECVVVASAASETVNRLRAVWVAREDVDIAAKSDEEMERALREFLRARLAPHKVPRRFERVPALARLASGKVKRVGL
ncbi:hypothetical protein BH11PLA1_BH11PLA1_00820 [soil metagenome]